MPAEVGPARTARLWVPHQHGAWAMLALPILVGVVGAKREPVAERIVRTRAQPVAGVDGDRRRNSSFLA